MPHVSFLYTCVPAILRECVRAMVRVLRARAFECRIVEYLSRNLMTD